jgi:biopolymer transport protein TolR
MKSRLHLVSELNVTSLADVSITLLIIFIISAPLLRSGVEVDLPRSQVSAPQPEEGIEVTITESSIYIEDQVVELEGIVPMLRAIFEAKPGARVYLRADAKVRYGLVIEVVGRIREAGVEELGLVAEPKEKEWEEGLPSRP